MERQVCIPSWHFDLDHSHVPQIRSSTQTYVPFKHPPDENWRWIPEPVRDAAQVEHPGTPRCSFSKHAHGKQPNSGQGQDQVRHLVSPPAPDRERFVGSQEP